MNKIINGKRYDTDTAKEITVWSSRHPQNDFNWHQETLYRKKTGEYFLHGEGGPMSKYSQAVGNNSWGYGERLIPLTEDAARKWAEERLDADEYESIFGEVSEDDTKRNVTYSLPVGLIEKIRKESEEKGITLSEVIASRFE